LSLGHYFNRSIEHFYCPNLKKLKCGVCKCSLDKLELPNLNELHLHMYYNEYFKELKLPKYIDVKIYYYDESLIYECRKIVESLIEKFPDYNFSMYEHYY